MGVINELIKQIDDKDLRDRIFQEVYQISNNRKFGLVFEEHLPEYTPIYGVSIKRGSVVSFKEKTIKDLFWVLDVKNGLAICRNKIDGQRKEIFIEELVVVAQFGEPIFPKLIPIDKVKNSNDNLLWHILIEADNYHALQLMEYLYPKQVDCIYIDPPYNTGARDWKYNNDYVDLADNWRHSKWLSMMQSRLKIAREILNPKTGVLIVTIDEHELHHLRILLEQLFPKAFIQIVTIVINPKGVARGRFSRVEEYAVYCFMPEALVNGSEDSMLGAKPITNKVRWASLLRSGTDARREDSKNLFYPILVDSINKRVVKAGKTLPFGQAPRLGEKIEGYDVAWPIRSDLSEGRWMTSNETLNYLINKGYVSLGKFDPKRKTWGITYLNEKSREKIEAGDIEIISKDEKKNVVNVVYKGTFNREIKTVWYRNTHDAGAYGSDLLSNILGKPGTFPFPKSLYAVKDSISAIVKNNPNALVVDFFAGSGTTLHAVNLLNEDDGGNRRCILVTNNEVSEKEENVLRKQGLFPGDELWEKNGICQSVTWPRVKFSIRGKRDDESIIEGEYITTKKIEREVVRSFYQIDFTSIDLLSSIKSKKQLVSLFGKGKIPKSLVKSYSRYIVSDKYTASILFDDNAYEEWISKLQDKEHILDFYIVTRDNNLFNEIKKKIEECLGNIIILEEFKKPISEGLNSNVEYFKIGFLDKSSVALGQQFKEILPMLWLKAGAVGDRPVLEREEEIPRMLIPDSSNFAILIDETFFAEFIKKIQDNKNIYHIFIVTNSEEAFREMTSQIKIKNVTQLYRDYIDNFVINSRRI